MKWNLPRMCFVLTLLIALSAMAVSQPAADRQYIFTSFDPPGSVNTFPIGINNNGLIAMQYADQDGIYHTATLKDDTYSVIDVPGAILTLAGAPNMEGQVALGFLGSDFSLHAAVYTRGHYTFLPDVPGQQHTSPSAMNARGQISGTTWIGDFIVVHGYLWDGRTYTIFDYPDPDIQQTLAFGINNRGQIVGQYTLTNGEIHGFFKDGEKYTEIAFPGAPNTAAFGINNSGEIVGLWGEAGPGPNGFAVGGRGFLLSKGIFGALDYPGAETSFPLGINDTGHIVGVYQNAGEVAFHGYLAAPVRKR